MTASAGQPPYLRVVRGEPTDAELAAVLAAVLAIRAARGAASPAGLAEPDSSRSEWASQYRFMRQPLHPGPGAWRASARRW